MRRLLLSGQGSQHHFARGHGGTGAAWWSGDGDNSCSCLSCLNWVTPGWDCRHTALPRITPLIPKQCFGAISRRSETKQLLGPKRHTSGFVSSSLDPLRAYLPHCILCSLCTKPSLLRSDLPLSALGFSRVKSQPMYCHDAEPCLLYILRSGIL